MYYNALFLNSCSPVSYVLANYIEQSRKPNFVIADEFITNF
jgi:hypothetical protein